MRTNRLIWMPVLIFVAFCGSAADVKDQRLMSNVEYIAYLDRLSLVLPRWGERIKQIDAAKLPNISYSLGKSVMDQRSLALTELGHLRVWIDQDRTSPKVSRQLAISNGLGSIYDGFGALSEMLVGVPQANSWFKDLDSLYAEIGGFRIALMNHVLAGVEKLEAKGCR
jgi:hypothetical protein